MLVMGLEAFIELVINFGLQAHIVCLQGLDLVVLYAEVEGRVGKLLFLHQRGDLVAQRLILSLVHLEQWLSTRDHATCQPG